MKEKRVFGELELAILNVFKGRESLTVRDVLELLKSDDKYTTIMTVMSRMADKGILAREKNGNQYEYSVNQKTAEPSLFDKLKNKIFGKKTVSLVSHLIETELNDNELEEIERLVKKLKKRNEK